MTGQLYLRVYKYSFGYEAYVCQEGRPLSLLTGATPEGLARNVQRNFPRLDHVECPDGRIEDTGALSLSECIEAVARS